jgi:hypothetical protein
MSDSASATLTFQDNILRYAEVERHDDGPRLLRLGAETVPFDLAAALLRREADPGQVQRVEEVLERVFDGAAARDLRLAVHPPQSYSFFTPISSEIPVRDRQRQLLQQAALVTGVRSRSELSMTSETVRTMQDSDGETFMWVHVLAMPDVVDQRIAALMESLPVREYAWMGASEAASRVTSRVERTSGSAKGALRPYTLAVGQYSTHTEYALSRNREWYHSHYAEEAFSAENRAYFAVGFLNRLDVPLDAVGRLFVYGTDVDLSAYRPFQSIFGEAPEILDPLRVVQRDDVASPDQPCAFAPCVGAGLDDFLG